MKCPVWRGYGSIEQVHAGSGKAPRVIRLAIQSSSHAGTYLVEHARVGRIYVLGRYEHRGALQAVDLHSGHAGPLTSLPEGISFRAIAIGSQTDRIFVFGDRPDGAGRAPYIAVLDPSARHLLRLVRVRHAKGLDWRVFAGAISLDERTLYVSYHGTNTTGIDALTAHGRSWLRCASAANAACVPDAHGAVAVRQDGDLVATTGDPPDLIDIHGKRVAHRWRTKLARNHLTELTLDVAGDTAYAIGSCAYTGGISKVVLHGAAPAKVLQPPATAGAPATLCGERATVTPTRTLIVARGAAPSLTAAASPALLVVSTQTGRLLEMIPVLAAPVDVLSLAVGR